MHAFRSPQRPSGAAPFLITLAASAAAVAAVVAWLERTDSPWLTVAAVVLLLALAGSAAYQIALLLGPDRRRPVSRAVWLAPALLAVGLVVSLELPIVGDASVLPSGSPAGTVRGFLGAVVDG